MNSRVTPSLEVAGASLEFDTKVKLALDAMMGVREYRAADLRNDRVLCLIVCPNRLL
jgi:hypothetical protein